MISFLKKLLFLLTSVYFLSGLVPSQFVFAQETEGSQLTYDNAQQMSQDIFSTLKDGLAQFKTQYDIASATTTDNTVAVLAKANGQALLSKYESLMNSLVFAERAYIDELNNQKTSGTKPSIAHALAAGVSVKKYSEIFSSTVRPLLISSPQAPVPVRNYMSSVVPRRLAEFAQSAEKIKLGMSTQDAEVKVLIDTDAMKDADRNSSSIAAKNSQAENDPNSCGITSSKAILSCADSILGWFIQIFIVNAALAAFALSGYFLNFAILFGLLSMKTLVSQQVYTLWLFTRSLALAGALFCFLYFIGMTLFGEGQKIQRAAVAMILFAVFSGFSFAVSTWMIDMSNIVTVSIYNSIDSSWSTSWANPVISSKYMQLLGYSNVKDFFTGPNSDGVLGASSEGQVVKNLLLAGTMLYNAYILLMMGIIFMVRDIGLIFGIILSPLLLVDQAIPKLNDLAKKYRKFFIGRIMIGPVFMLLTYLGMKLTSVIKGGVDASRTLSGPSGNLGLIFFNLISITAIFYYTYKACKELSGGLTATVLGAADSIAKKAMIATPIGLAGKAGAFVGQQTIGRLARKVHDSGAISGNGYFADKARKATQYAGYGATYDFNNSKVVANAQATFAQKTGFDPRGGYAGASTSYSDQKERVTKDLQNSIQKELKNTDTIKDPEKRRLAREAILGRNTRGILGKGSLLLSNKERTEAVRKVRQLTENETKKKFQDELTAIDFTNLSEKNPEELAKFKAALAPLIKDAEKSGPEMEKWFEEYLKKKTISSLSDSIKESADPAFDPLRKDFSQNANAKMIAVLSQTGVDLVLNDEEKKKLSDIFSKQMESYVSSQKEVATRNKKAENAYEKVVIDGKNETDELVTATQSMTAQMASLTDAINNKDLMSTIKRRKMHRAEQEAKKEEGRKRDDGKQGDPHTANKGGDGPTKTGGSSKNEEEMAA